MNKEWLVDKKEQLKSATVFINENGNEAVEVSLSVLNKLIEQAERVEEWKWVASDRYRDWEKLEKQNKRYREVITDMNYHRFSPDIIEEIYQALEGEE